jgi:hypothetical protein
MIRAGRGKADGAADRYLSKARMIYDTGLELVL